MNDFEKIHAAIESLPQKIFDTEIEVKNGGAKKIRFRDAVIQNYENTQRLEKEIKDGTILVPITEDMNNFMPLSKILSTLYKRPASWFEKTREISDGISKIISALVVLGLAIWAIVELLKRIHP